jgi:hypothetical protein
MQGHRMSGWPTRVRRCNRFRDPFETDFHPTTRFAWVEGSNRLPVASGVCSIGGGELFAAQQRTMTNATDVIAQRCLTLGITEIRVCASRAKDGRTGVNVSFLTGQT